ncbi:helix-turn-helix transcriptional regulator [Kordia zhangzhouensis]|uniref:helix-turn-helix transcriptional regulator n=1 Tax=Kordia zhangzhouensis TaxID=1620405 RepID=UPI000AF51768|nr:helix-turn-helix transcriptional regulator [Kordia zhangzhouensis]
MKQPKLGQKIAALRKEKGLTQEELIERCNVSIRTIQRIEAGEVTPRSYTLKAIFEALDYNLEIEQQEKRVFEESCEIRANWFQEPKSWMMYAWVFVMTSALFILQLIFKDAFNIEYYFFMAMLLGVQLVFVGNSYSSKNRGKYNVENAPITIEFNGAKVLGYLLLALSTEFYLIFIVFNYQINTITSVFVSIFFGLIMIFPMYFMLKHVYPYLNKFLGKKIGLVISDEGLMDNSMFVTNTIIPWKDIERVEVAESTFGYKWVVPILKNPEIFINQQNNHFKKAIAKANYRKYGSPLKLYTTTLHITPSELYKIVCLRIQNNYD